MILPRIWWTRTLALVLPASVAFGQEVLITGGTEDGHNFTWSVSNRADRPIDLVEIPYCGADVVEAPPGWVFQATAGLVGQGGGGVGRVIFRAEAARAAIRPGQSLTLGMRIRPGTTFTGKGTATVGFTDGRRIQIDGVECSLVEPWLRRNFPMVGLAGCFAFFILLAGLKKKRGPKEGSEAPRH